MPLLENLVAQIAEHKKSLDELRSQSPEMAEALRLNDEYHHLMNTLREMCSTPTIQTISTPIEPPRPFWEAAAIQGSTCAIRLVK